MRLDPDMFRRLCIARDLLRASADEPLTVEQIAHRVAISPFHFIRRFEALFGTTPNQLRMRWRIERAKRLLAAGEHSVTETCMEVGFSSLGTFSALFKSRVGTTPSAYRRRMRTAVPGALEAVLRPSCFGLMCRLPASAFRSFREA